MKREGEGAGSGRPSPGASRLPADVARCDGQSFGLTCGIRDACRRYLERPEEGLAWWMTPQVLGPCDAHIPARSAPNPLAGEGPSPSNPQLPPSGGEGRP